MKYFILSLLIILTHSRVIFADEYEDNIEFIVFNNATGTSFVSTFNKSLSDDGCNVKGKFAFFTHGWMGSSNSWINGLMRNLSFYRGGCIIFMNYSHFSDDINYFKLISHFKPISQLVARKLNQLRLDGVSSDNIYMFGFSFGGRIVIEAALIYGPKEISSIDSKLNDFYFAFF
jgi:predicted alpha/beta-fold hydrolase